MARRLAPIILNVALGVLALGLAFAAPGEGAPRMRLAFATGSLSLSNSKEGAAIFRAEAMRPGEEASGTVVIANTGTVTGALTVSPAATQDAPGAGGGKLSNRLDLLVIDVTDVNAPATVYSGALKAMGTVALGDLGAGQQRTFLFVASLKPGGSADNAFQGSALTTAFTWTATGGGGTLTPTPTPTPTQTPTATPSLTPVATPQPAVAPDPGAGPAGPPATTPPPGSAGPDPDGTLFGAQVFAMPAAKSCLSRRSLAITVRRPNGLVFKSLTITANSRTKVKLTGLKARKVKAKVNLRGLPKGTVVVKVVAVTTTGRKASSTRTYHTCATKKRRKR